MATPKVQRLTPSYPRGRPKCVHPVKPNKYGYHDRIRSSKAPDLCGRPAMFIFGEQPMCQAHAAFESLQFLLVKKMPS